MPTGTGKTVCLLALIVSYIKMKRPNFKLVYCTRTIVEMEKTLEELRLVMKQREIDFGGLSDGPDHSLSHDLRSPVLAMCLSSRKNLCIHEKVSKLDEREKVDSACRSLTASWVRERATSEL
jgi:DNA excision repair protein ERCC-2